MFNFLGRQLSREKVNFKDLDLAFIDTETTGRGFEHELIEIAVIRANNYNFAVLDEWETKIKPKRIDLADPESLKATRYSESDWSEAIDLEEALKIFLKKTESSILVAHNLSFDWFYINKALREFNLEPTFWIKGLDTISLAWMKLRAEPNIKKLSISELTKYFNIPREKPHSALDDARTAYKLFLNLITRNQ